MVKTISFGEIVKGRDASVRITDDGLVYAVDLVMVVTGKNRNDAGQALRNIPGENFSAKKFTERNTGGSGNVKTKLISFQDAIELIMVLPGKRSTKIRKQYRDIIVRDLDGDQSMHSDIQANAEMGMVKSYCIFASNAMKQIDSGVDADASTIPVTSYIYATKSDAFPGLIKIGRTSNLSARLSYLNTGCAPSPHAFVALAPTFDAQRDEMMAHIFFANARREGEFFEVDDGEVQEYFAHHITAQYNVEMTRNIAKFTRNPDKK